MNKERNSVLILIPEIHSMTLGTCCIYCMITHFWQADAVDECLRCQLDRLSSCNLVHEQGIGVHCKNYKEICPWEGIQCTGGYHTRRFDINKEQLTLAHLSLIHI